ncbi:glycosyl transferase family 1 [Arthrobacter agilis]|uniref:Glycosyl transferase family 1 n=1 Tax=Arthrobacter agilis TaxID=37921 RepID=A0A2L0UC56_9MICC|nr:glycosyltransferase family 4 protein [Arthrobacter agilis]AUZ86818.1 glycosyl transferase family 1 [Arthrobacter agilis]
MDLTGQKIVIAHPSADLYGSDRMMLETLEGLSTSGADVVVVVPNDGPLLARVSARHAVPVIVPSLVLRKSLLSARGVLSLVAGSAQSIVRISVFLARNRPDIVYVSTLSIPWWPIIARLAGCRVLVHIHEAEGHVRPIIRHLLALPLLFSSELIANSRYTVKVLGQSLPRTAARAQVVYNGVAGPASVRRPREELSDPVRLIYFGRISHRKGVDVAIDAVAELRRRGRVARLDVVGAVFGGNEDYARELEDRIQRTGLQDSVRMVGFREDVWASLDDADIVLIPARLDESFGNTVVEAMLAARPAVVSAMPGLLEAGDGFGSVHFVEPDDVGRLASAIEAIVDDWARWSGLAVQDRLRAQEHHAPGKYRDEVVASIVESGDS